MGGQQILIKPCIKVDGAGRVDILGEPGHGQAATDHAGFDFFRGISLSPKHQAAAGARGRAAMTLLFPCFTLLAGRCPGVLAGPQCWCSRLASNLCSGPSRPHVSHTSQWSTGFIFPS